MSGLKKKEKLVLIYMMMKNTMTNMILPVLEVKSALTELAAAAATTMIVGMTGIRLRVTKGRSRHGGAPLHGADIPPPAATPC